VRALNPRLQARLDGGATTLCRCWRLDRRDGRAFGFTDHDGDLAFDGVTFAAASGVTGGAQEAATGLAAGTVGFAGALTAAAMTEADLVAGLWDGARLRRWLVDWREPDVRALIFDGTLGEVTREDGAFRAEALGPAAGLNRPIGRAFLRDCDAALGDRRCRADLTRSGLRGTGTVTAVRGEDLIEIAAAGVPADGRLAGGALTWTGGAAAGATVRVTGDLATAAGRTLRLAVPGPIAVGDAFAVTAGCDGGFATCRDRFGNAANFRGFPHLPGDDWLARGPGDDEPADGGSRHG
jgi:uncharacterized phage protein (TIGR02218 family)